MSDDAQAGRDRAFQGRLRVITYNIRHGQGIDGKVDLARTAATLRELDPDVVVLNEVDVYWARSRFQDQVKSLAGMLGHRYAFFAPALARPLPPGRLRPWYGNALLSRFPVTAFDVVRLPRSGRSEPRVLFHAVLDLGGTPLHLFGTHLGLSRDERRRQVAVIRERIEGFLADAPVLLLGDFNEPPSESSLQPLRELLVEAFAALGRTGRAAHTYPAGRPWVQIDAAFLSPALLDALVDVQAVSSDASDHLPVVIDLDFGRPLP